MRLSFLLNFVCDDAKFSAHVFYIVESDDVDLSTWTRSAPGVSVLLLEYLRTLPEPLLTFDKYDSFLMVRSLHFFDRVFLLLEMF